MLSDLIVPLQLAHGALHGHRRRRLLLSSFLEPPAKKVASDVEKDCRSAHTRTVLEGDLDQRGARLIAVPVEFANIAGFERQPANWANSCYRTPTPSHLQFDDPQPISTMPPEVAEAAGT